MDGLEDDALMRALGQLCRKGTRVLRYPREVREVVTRLFEDPADPSSVIRFHDGASVPKDAYYGRGTTDADRWSLDHIWPKAFGFKDHRGVISDLHNIAIADFTHNARRGAGLYYDRRLDHLARDVEIAPQRYFDPRGVIARACLYMTCRYQGDGGDPRLELDEREHVRGENHIGSRETLLLWNKLAPVTREERRRNDIIAETQGNRNPFVDRPSFADLIWFPV
ncbi:MAG: endonuclease [Myxococcota bacterium]